MFWFRSKENINGLHNFREGFRDEPSSMMSKETVGSRDHRYLHQDLVIQVVLFTQMMDQQNPLSSLVDSRIQTQMAKRQKFYILLSENGSRAPDCLKK